MWQQVTAKDPDLVNRAFAVLSPCDEVQGGVSEQELLKKQEVYFLDAGNCELAAGFEYSPIEKVWRIRCAGIRGDMSLENAVAVVEFAAEFAKKKGIHALYAATNKRDTTSATEVLYRVLRDVALKDQRIADIRWRTLGRRVLWEISFK